MKFHPGERQVQARLGVQDAAAALGDRAIRDSLPEQHRNMICQLPFLIAASHAPDKRLWATLLPGHPGFARAPSDRELHIHSRPAKGDALEQGFACGSDIGLLAIALETRRRNRINGVVAERSDAALAVTVKQCFGNCPQYISSRQWQPREDSPKAAYSFRPYALTEMCRDWINGADTFFIASGFNHRSHSASGLDVSHRGGPRGFVEALNKRQLQFPDYSGNNFFNTLGNIVLNPQVGLLFIDFNNGSLLQLSGRAQIDWNTSSPNQSQGAQRMVKVDIEEVVVSLNSLPIYWK